MKLALITCAIAALSFASCKSVSDKKSKPAADDTSKTDKTSKKTVMPPGHAKGGTAGAKKPWRGVGLSGKVLETMDSGGYTYAKLDVAGKQVWVAGPKTKIAVGEQVVTTKGTMMANFKSNSLKRTFDRIHFVSAFGRPPGSGTAQPGGLSNKAGSPHTKKPATTTTAPTSPMKPAAGGKTVAQLFAEKATLAGKQVAVRGKVVKFSAGIMNRNWIHLRDGTGKSGTNDLTITTNEKVTVGDDVTIRGTVAVDKNFGGGYRYALIVEGAKVTKN